VRHPVIQRLDVPKQHGGCRACASPVRGPDDFQPARPSDFLRADFTARWFDKNFGGRPAERALSSLAQGIKNPT